MLSAWLHNYLKAKCKNLDSHDQTSLNQENP